MKGIPNFCDSKKGNIPDAYEGALQNTTNASRELVVYTIPTMNWQVGSEQANAAIARVCLTYLSHTALRNFKDETLDIADIAYSYPFFEYATVQHSTGCITGPKQTSPTWWYKI